MWGNNCFFFRIIRRRLNIGDQHVDRHNLVSAELQDLSVKTLVPLKSSALYDQFSVIKSPEKTGYYCAFYFKINGAETEKWETAYIASG